MDENKQQADSVNQTDDNQKSGNTAIPVSGQHKEMGPVARVTVEAPLGEYLAASPQEAEPIIPSEVKEAGVELSPNVETPQIKKEEERAGIEASAPNIPVTAVSGKNNIEFPSTEELTQQIKNTSSSDSAHWSAVLMEYILKKLGRNK